MPWAEIGQAFLAQQATSTLWQCQSTKNPPEVQLKEKGCWSWKVSSLAPWAAARSVRRARARGRSAACARRRSRRRGSAR